MPRIVYYTVSISVNYVNLVDALSRCSYRPTLGRFSVGIPLCQAELTKIPKLKYTYIFEGRAY